MSTLLPSSDQAIASRGRHNWHQLEQAKPYIENLTTGNIDDQINAVAMSAMISGIPSPWARAKLFQSAFGYSQNAQNGLGQFCKLIVGEWKGLLALLAIHPNRITFKQVTLNYTNTSAGGSLHLANAMGRMLFDEKDLWTDPELLANSDPNALPYVQMVYYRDKLIGFVSPYTFVCTAAEYDYPELQSDISWFRQGKLNDPMPYLGNDRNSLQKVNLLLHNLRTKINDFQAEINRNRRNNTVTYNSLIEVLDKWLSQLGMGQGSQQGTLDAELHFNRPYHGLFNISQEIWFNYASRVFSRQNPNNGAHCFDIRKLLLDSPYLSEFDNTDNNQPLESAAVHYLTATESNGKKRYFALPLSQLGVIIFQSKLADILTSVNGGLEHSLKAEIKGDKLLVRLSLCIDNALQPPIDREYAIESQQGMTPKCIIWPNFYSIHWSRYYFYSELPRNASGFKMYPFYRKVALDENTRVFIDEIETENEKASLVFNKPSTRNLLKYPVGQVDNGSHKYELIQSETPIGGIEIRVDRDGSETPCGILILKKGQNAVVENLSTTHAPNAGCVAQVGIDFGSNNTCISYEYNGNISPINFRNRRIFITGTEVIDPNNEYFAQSHELLFFQNESPLNGQIKSWINRPDGRYCASDVANYEFVAGNPVFEPNIDVKELEEFRIRTNNGHIIDHNLKWKNDAHGITAKEGFMKTLFMKICAELYTNDNIKPAEIIFKWSYPSALSKSDQRSYAAMYNTMIEHRPINRVGFRIAEPVTESQAVCNYAIGPGEIAVHQDTMMIGIDVGGSTSDILLVASVDNVPNLIQQSSVRLSAGKMAAVIENSNTFAQSILSFAETRAIKIAGIDKINQNKRNAPYYLNALFDRLQDEQFADLYRNIYQNPRVANRAKSIFAIPAFITGALMYYSGQLAKYAIDSQKLGSVKKFSLYPFGKGGRIFDWLPARLGTKDANQYYEDCFKAGLNTHIEGFNLDFFQDRRRFIKSEVSMGLLRENVISHNPNNKIDIVGEEGFIYNQTGLNDQSEINSTHFKNLGAITFPNEFLKFKEFLNIYNDLVGINNGDFLPYAKQTIDAKTPELRDMLYRFIQNDPQYQQALRAGDNFGYSQPIFILTAMSFLDSVIIPFVQQETGALHAVN
jgi:hypothetical protein